MTKPYKLLVLMAETDIRLMLMYDETLQTVSFDGRDRHKTNVNVWRNLTNC